MLLGRVNLLFKPNTDDMREAPSRILLADLLRRGASVAAHDPVAMKEARRVLARDLIEVPDAIARIRFVSSQDEALQDADALVVVTDWKAFCSPDFDLLRQQLRQPIIFDGRNLFAPEALAMAGFEYYGIGR